MWHSLAARAMLWMMILVAASANGESASGSCGERQNHTQQCGDNVCDSGETVTNCFEDCYSRAQRTAANVSCGPPERLPSGYPLADDTIGLLINNQYLWKMPGAEFLAAGFDLLEGGPTVKRVFQYTYCNSANHTMSNLERGLVYGLPDQLLAVPHPSCDYSTQTRSFSSSQQLATSMSSETNVAASLHASYSGFGVSAGVDAAYSQDKAVSAAADASSSNSGTLTHTRVHCSVARAALDRTKINFALEFLAEVAAANSTNELISVIEDYGLFHYARAELGGELSMSSSVDTSKVSLSKSSELHGAQSASFSAKVSGWGVSAGAAGSYASTKSSTSEGQADFERAAKHTDVLSRGGAPGSFGPSITGAAGDEAPMTWGAWASTVDLAPWPIKYDVDLTENLFDPNWTFSKCPHDPAGSCTVIEAWRTAKNAYLSSLDQPDDAAEFILRLETASVSIAADIHATGLLYVQLMSSDTQPIGQPHIMTEQVNQSTGSEVSACHNRYVHGIQAVDLTPSLFDENNTSAVIQLTFQEPLQGHLIDTIRGIQITMSNQLSLTSSIEIESWTLTSPSHSMEWVAAGSMTLDQERLRYTGQSATCASNQNVEIELWLCPEYLFGNPWIYPTVNAYAWELRMELVTSVGRFPAVLNAVGWVESTLANQHVEWQYGQHGEHLAHALPACKCSGPSAVNVQVPNFNYSSGNSTDPVEIYSVSFLLMTGTPDSVLPAAAPPPSSTPSTPAPETPCTGLVNALDRPGVEQPYGVNCTGYADMLSCNNNATILAGCRHQCCIAMQFERTHDIHGARCDTARTCLVYAACLGMVSPGSRCAQTPEDPGLRSVTVRRAAVRLPCPEGSTTIAAPMVSSNEQVEVTDSLPPFSASVRFYGNPVTDSSPKLKTFLPPPPVCKPNHTIHVDDNIDLSSGSDDSENTGAVVHVGWIFLPLVLTAMIGGAIWYKRRLNSRNKTVEHPPVVLNASPTENRPAENAEGQSGPGASPDALV